MSALEYAAYEYAKAHDLARVMEQEFMLAETNLVCQTGIPCYVNTVDVTPCHECETVINAYTNYCMAKIMENDELQKLLYHARRIGTCRTANPKS